ncbi:hypothetical protein QOZ88_12670 [Blastococcus sp. BMG 814]|uniref:Uncharacterized protein n=1 Tax=Blastococcus carthaginiensis TaxID=3050034 RepID=A0ABT9ID32_9ACTN|nr:hypothetical protein [Blastococcus carthaginiensis]MDP5183491.1 hypothetical protein [Blastococcus carthaginiensis]
MTDNRYAIGLDALEAGSRVEPADQVAEQPAPGAPPPAPAGEPHPFAGGAGGDADGD